MTPSHRKDDPPGSEPWKDRKTMDLRNPHKINVILSATQIVLLVGGLIGGLTFYADEREFRRNLVTVTDLEAVQDEVVKTYPDAKYIQTRRAIADARRKQ